LQASRLAALRLRPLRTCNALLRDTNPGEATALIMHVRVGMSDLGNPEGVGGRSGEIADFLEDAPRNFKLHRDCCEDSPR